MCLVDVLTKYGDDRSSFEILSPDNGIPLKNLGLTPLNMAKISELFVLPPAAVNAEPRWRERSGAPSAKFILRRTRAVTTRPRAGALWI